MSQPPPSDHLPSGDLPSANEVTLALDALQRGDAGATEQLLQAVYDELRQLAHARVAREPGAGAGMTLDATALVHEAYLRVVGSGDAGPAQKPWTSRGHFFGAAALAMRRILVERARHRRRERHGGGRERVNLPDELVAPPAMDAECTDLIALDAALEKLEQLDPRKAKVVSLRFFAGLTIDETADAMDLSPATVKNDWTFARAWLHRELSGQ
jgi:RNA polymerase sigma factor (TIGR02999 family)